ncbi:MAG: hypothetical protein A2X86_17765 [Bdellovibrionales bacterium GWA2_49_15]|nr:MAG: hypothetical protein A2X86_17765 [Bdellovibrionales bacterium GWA2_49_15]HAZ14982.1 hypothetical protein [Bdellovibrionales bacterium]
MKDVSNTRAAIAQSLGVSNTEIYSTGLALIKKFQTSGPILDFGAGKGHFLQMLEGQSFLDCTGADLMDRPADIPASNQWIQADLNHRLPVADETYDVIMAIEVIEHLENPRATAREWRRILKPNGLLIFSTPNNESWRALIALFVRGHFVSFLEKDYPAHITALTRLDITRILQENAFNHAGFFYTTKGLVPGLKGVTWQQLSMGLCRGRRFSDNIFTVARKV